MDLHSVMTADGVRTVVNPSRPSLMTPKIPMNPNRAVAEAVAQEHKRADDSLAHRLAMDVLGLTDDPLKAAIEKMIPESVDGRGNITARREAPVRRHGLIPGSGRR